MISAINHETGKGLFSYFKANGYQIPSNRLMVFDTSPIGNESNVPSNVLDNNTQTYWDSAEYTPYFTLDFRRNKVALKGFSIHGINNPYTIAFNISGSNNGNECKLIKEYNKEDLGDDLFDKNKLFTFEELTDFYHYIKIQSILSLYKNNSVQTHLSTIFGMRELEIFGVFLPSHFFVKTICDCSYAHAFTPYIFIFLL